MTMINDVRYKINCPEEICELLERQTTLRESVDNLERAIECHLRDLDRHHNTVECLKKSITAREALIEEARKELEAREKSLAAAEKEAKKRGKTVSKATELAVVKAREHLEKTSTDTKPTDLEHHAGIVSLRNYLASAEIRYNETRLAIDEKRDRIARMSAERESIKSPIEEFVIEYVAAHPKKGDDIDI